MRVRVLELRLLAAALSIGWSLAAGLVLLGYHPGGPMDLGVGLAAGLPILVAVAGLVWPPVARQDRAFGAIAWLGLGSLMLLAPSIGGLLTQLQARGPQTLMPSPEAAYPWFLALLGTSVFAGLGIARRSLGETALRRRRLARGVVIGLAAALLVALAFAGTAIANEIGLRDRTVPDSRFGPTNPLAEPPGCQDPLAVGPGAQVNLVLDGAVDGRSIGTVEIRGTRNGGDVRWLAYVATSRELGPYGAARIGSRAWQRGPEAGWTSVAADRLPDPVLDARVLQVALAPGPRVAAEMHGIDVFEGARARHCRVAIDGETFRLAFPEVEFLVGPADLSRWRGELDYWVFADGQLGRLSGSVSGEGGPIVAGGLQATLRATMIATDRARPHQVAPPVR